MARHSYVSLVVVGVDMASGQKYVVCDSSEGIPVTLLYDSYGAIDMVTVAKKQFEKCSPLSSNWAQISIVAAVILEDDPFVSDINIIYTCQIPLDTLLSNEYTWKRVSEITINDKSVVEAVLSAVRNT